jgi:hypothetical protein
MTVASETKENIRPIWQRKTEVGTVLMIGGALLSFIPPVAVIGAILTKIGGVLVTVGVAHRNFKGQSK